MMSPIQTPPNNVIMTLVMFFIVSIPFAVIAGKIAERKGKKFGLALILGLIPFVNITYIGYLISLVDIEVLNLLDELSANDRGTK